MTRLGVFPAVAFPLYLAALVATTPSAARASIDLEWRPDDQVVFIGDTVNIGLYAVSDNEGNQSLSAVDLIFAWDPDFLRLLGVDNTGAEPLLFSDFPDPDPYNLNEVIPPQDGDGFYQAMAPLGELVEATPAGLRLTTFQFEALDETPSTLVDILESGGSPVGYTTVFDGEIPNLPVTGMLGGATVTIIPEPGSALGLVFAGLAVIRARRK